jgi:hypothetical protein
VTIKGLRLIVSNVFLIVSIVRTATGANFDRKA